jgi:hypothetical protein
MEHFDIKTEGIKPEDTEFYVEIVVMKDLYDKGEIKSKVMFRRERESAYEIIKSIEKKLQIEKNDKTQIHV